MPVSPDGSHGDLRVRASDGLSFEKTSGLALKPTEGPLAECFSKNKFVEVGAPSSLGALGKLLKGHPKKGEKFILAPVSGETRVLGVLVLGPFSSKEKLLPRGSGTAFRRSALRGSLRSLPALPVDVQLHAPVEPRAADAIDCRARLDRDGPGRGLRSGG